MTRDDIIRWARESGGLPDPMVFIGAYERFANLVAAAEREACADIVENADTPDCGGWTAQGIADTIRERGTT